MDFVVAVILRCCMDTIDAVNDDKKQNSMQRRKEEQLDTLGLGVVPLIRGTTIADR